MISEKLLAAVQSYIEQNLEQELCVMEAPLKCYSLKSNSSVENYECSKEIDCFLNVDNYQLASKAHKSEKRSLKDLVLEIESTFAETLFKYIDDKGLSDPEVYKRANLDRKLFSKIRKNKNYKPSKNTALALAIALKLNLDETKDFIGKAGYALTHSSKMDIIVEFFIKQNNYDIFELNDVLFYYEEPLLGSNVA